MKRRFHDLLAPFSVVSLFALSTAISGTETLTCTIRLDHEWPVYGSYIEYVPVEEKAYIVTDHVMFTRNPLPGHFPGDGRVIGTNSRAYFYWVDRRYGVKAFITEDVQLPLHARIIPERLRMLYYPSWVRASYRYVREELDRDGGWRDRVAVFREDRRTYDMRWEELTRRSEERRRLFDEWLEGLDESRRSDLGRLYEYRFPGEWPFGLGRKGD